MSGKLKTLLVYFEDETKNFSGCFGLAAQRIDANRPILYQADLTFPTASVIKLVVLAEYFAQVGSGRLAPERQVVLRTSDQVGGSGVLKDLGPGLRFTLHDLAMLTIAVGDNTAANLLIEQVGGLEPVNARLQALGMTNTSLDRPFIFDSTANNTGTPADCLRLLLTLARHQFINPAISQQMLGLMRRQQYTSYILRYLPYQPIDAEPGFFIQIVTLADRAGVLPGAINDAALITTPSCAYALVIFTRDCQDNRPDADNEGALMVARLSERVYDYMLDVS